MAEAIALLGVVAAGVQCAQVGVQLLMLGSSLRSKLQDAPDKVKRWLGQIEQLVALAELIKQTDADLSRLLPPPSLSSARSAAAWVEAALLDCTGQARALQDVLKDMLQEVDDRKGQKIWKTILTVKRETRITSALHEIERQKSMLNIWLGQNNLRQLDDLHHTVQDFRDGVEKVDRHMLHVEQTFCEEFQNLSTAFHSSSRATTSGLECLRNLGTSSVESLGQQMQQYHGELQSESSVMQLQLHALTQEMRAIKREFRRLATFRAQVSRTPSLLQEALQEHTESHALCLDTGNNSRHREIKGCSSTVTKICSCHATSRFGLLNFGVNVQVALIHRNMHVKDCPAHKNMKSCFAAIRCYAQSTILENLVKLSFEATRGGGGFSMGMLLRTYRRVQKHPMESFFKDLYRQRRHKHGSKYPSYDDKAQYALVRLTQRELWRAFNSGIASPNDVDSHGKTLLHLQIEYSGTIFGSEYRMCAQIIKLLISMGAKADSLDDRFRTTLQLLLEQGTFQRLAGDQDSINSDILEWTGIRPREILDGVLMVDCMRRWPESKEDWGYPYICDILLRKSKVDLVSFISRGMKPVEETFRRLTPLHLAAAANWPEAVALLLAGGADKYAQDSELCLPIDFAMHTKCLEAVELLLEGDCIPNFIRPRKHGITTIPLAMLIEIHSGKGSVQNALVRTLIRLRHFLGALRPYHDLALLAWDKEPGVAAADRLFSAGFRDLELRDEHGMTPLMKACLYATLQFLRFLLEKGANASTPHRDSALTAGYFLAGSMDFDSSFSAADSELCAKLLQAAFNVADTVDSNCLCSPEGFTPVTALSRSKNGDKRRKFGTLMLCLQGLKGAVEQQARAFALGEIFDRLQMTHTCVNIHQPSQQIPEEDRLEIESEEEEFSMQLRELMKEYDLGRVEFSGGPLEFLDFFFEMQELNLPSQDYPWIWSHKYNSNDKDLLGPGVQYQSCRASFAGKQIFYGHREEVNEENMLALLFDEDYTWV